MHPPFVLPSRKIGVDDLLDKIAGRTVVTVGRTRI
jgi:hypothetical protein